MEKIKVNILDTDETGFIADNGNYYFWEEATIDSENNGVAFVLPPPPPKILKFKCKPTFNFQSIEFEIECEENNLEPMFDIYKRVVEGLISVSPDQPKNGVVAKPASSKQIEIMDKFRIPYQPGISYEAADAKIQESMKKAREKNRSY